MKESEMEQIGVMMGKVLNNIDSEKVQREVREEVKAFTDQFPLYVRRLVPVP
jgi:glycine/serine hydroxymethyltransferase